MNEFEETKKRSQTFYLSEDLLNRVSKITEGIVSLSTFASIALSEKVERMEKERKRFSDSTESSNE
ncbi:MAG: hypothetical protein ACE5FT_07005 [Candidatus Nanoarchaeia archaeon]